MVHPERYILQVVESRIQDKCYVVKGLKVINIELFETIGVDVYNKMWRTQNELFWGGPEEELVQMLEKE